MSVRGEAIRHLRADNWKEARKAFETAERNLTSFSPAQQVQILLGLALCHLASGHNVEAKNVLARCRPLAPAGTNSAKFVGVLQAAADKDFFADPLMLPPTGGAGFDLGNIVPAEVSFLKHSFLQLVVDA